MEESKTGKSKFLHIFFFFLFPKENPLSLKHILLFPSINEVDSGIHSGIIIAQIEKNLRDIKYSVYQKIKCKKEKPSPIPENPSIPLIHHQITTTTARKFFQKNGISSKQPSKYIHDD